MQLLVVFVLTLLSHATAFTFRTNANTRLSAQRLQMASDDTTAADGSSPPLDVEVTSKEIVRLEKKIEEVRASINATQAMRREVNDEYSTLNAEFGPEIDRVKSEFSRMKERSIEEATDLMNSARANALKDVLPITDSYVKVKGIFSATTTPTEEKILDVYANIHANFQKVIEGFGLQRVESVGKPFDYMFMEAIMTAPSDEYAKDIVSLEYQTGYKMGNKSIRPAMVVVSTGPGPQ